MSKPVPLFQRAEQHRAHVAVIDDEATLTYGQLLEVSARVGGVLLDGIADLREQRIAYLVAPNCEYVAVQWGIWRAGGIAVPLALQHPTPELEYVIDNADVSAVIVHPDLEDRVRTSVEARSLRLIRTVDALAGEAARMPVFESGRRALMLYTSGTTSRPKGVVTTHDNIQAQVESLVGAWEWRCDDHILNVLPLHHIHGVINVLTCAMWSGATCEMLPAFDVQRVWSLLCRGDLTLLMAVPTVYAKLIAAWDQAPPEKRKMMSEACRQLRLMVCGSAALPITTLEKWKEISGHVLLERYGMTEIGMALSNPLFGQRRPGHVGRPLPGVEVRLVDEQGNPVAPAAQGEIEVSGPSVFSEYWRQPEATKAAFRQGWFRTGDVAIENDGVYRILGRNSVDIIKTGGYKVSALEIEEILRTHPDVRECAVVGVEDQEWGECVSAGLVLECSSDLTLEELRTWAKQRLAVYKVPKQILRLDHLPRNAMGKVHKPTVVKMFRERAERK